MPLKNISNFEGEFGPLLKEIAAYVKRTYGAAEPGNVSDKDWKCKIVCSGGCAAVCAISEGIATAVAAAGADAVADHYL